MKIYSKTNIRKWISAFLFTSALAAAALTSLVSNNVFANESQLDNPEQLEPTILDKRTKRGPPKKRHGTKHPRLKGPMVLIDQLDIDPKQRAQAQQIITEQHQKRMSIHQQSRQNHQISREKMREIHQQTIERLGGVLSPEQLKEFEHLLEQSKSQRPPHHRKGNKRGERKDSFNENH